MAKPTFTTDLIPNNEIMEVCKFEQKSFRYQEYQKGYSQFKK